MKRIKLLIAISVISVLIATFSSHFLTKKEEKVIRFGELAFPIVPFLPMYVAKCNNFFTEEGLKVEFVPSPHEGYMLSLVRGGKLDGGYVASTAQIMALSENIPIKSVCGAGKMTKENPQYALVVRNDSTILSLQDIKGKTIGGMNKNVIINIIFDIYLHQHNMSLLDVNMLEIGHPVRILEGIQSGSLDGGIVGDVHVASAPMYNGRVLFWFGDAIPDVEQSYIFFTREFTEKHPELIFKFLKVWMKSINFTKTHREEAAECMSNLTGIPKEAILSAPWIEWEEDCRMNITAQEELKNEMLKLGYITRDIDIRELIDLSYVGP